MNFAGTAKKRWGAEQRLEFIEFVAYWDRAINRSHLMDRFGISAPQASADLTAYQQLAPTNLRYDLRSKRYEATEEFQCKLIRPDADRYLKQLFAIKTGNLDSAESWMISGPPTDVVPMPTRQVSPELLRAILSAVRSEASIEVKYQSMNESSPDLMWRIVTPHALASDGMRWHMRAYCHKDLKFKDFLLSRCRGARSLGAAGATASDDDAWNRYFEVQLIPNPKLLDAHKRAIEYDYAMEGGTTSLAVRYALLYYFDKRLRSEIAVKQAFGALGDPRETPVVVANLTEYKDALRTVGVRVD
jgi:hypothetical protein